MIVLSIVFWVTTCMIDVRTCVSLCVLTIIRANSWFTGTDFHLLSVKNDF